MSYINYDEDGVHTSTVVGKWFRLVYRNGPVAQSFFRLQTIYHRFKQTSSGKELDSTQWNKDQKFIYKSIWHNKKIVRLEFSSLLF